MSTRRACALADQLGQTRTVLKHVSGLLGQGGALNAVGSQSGSRTFNGHRVYRLPRGRLPTCEFGLPRTLSTSEATASSDCSRISGLSCGALTLRAMMEVARGEPIVTAALSSHRA